jgi:hypothetical protein
MLKKLLTATIGLLLTTGSAFAQNAPTAPAAEVQNGKYYAWVQPQGWTSLETSMGVEITHPDGVTQATASVIQGDLGMTARQLLHEALRVGPSRDVQITSEKTLPDGTEELEGTFTYNGRKMKGILACKIYQGKGAFLVGIQAPVEIMDRAEKSLRQLAGSVRMTSEKAGILDESSEPQPNAPTAPAGPAANDQPAPRASNDRNNEWR